MEQNQVIQVVSISDDQDNKVGNQDIIGEQNTKINDGKDENQQQEIEGQQEDEDEEDSEQEEENNSDQNKKSNDQQDQSEEADDVEEKTIHNKPPIVQQLTRGGSSLDVQNIDDNEKPKGKQTINEELKQKANINIQKISNQIGNNPQVIEELNESFNANSPPIQQIQQNFNYEENKQRVIKIREDQIENQEGKEINTQLDVPSTNRQGTEEQNQHQIGNPGGRKQFSESGGKNDVSFDQKDLQSNKQAKKAPQMINTKDFAQDTRIFTETPKGTSRLKRFFQEPQRHAGTTSLVVQQVEKPKTKQQQQQKKVIKKNIKNPEAYYIRQYEMNLNFFQILFDSKKQNFIKFLIKPPI